MQTGDVFYSYHPTGPKVREYKCHVLAIVDEDHVVFKWYGKHKQWWHYEVMYIETVKFWIEKTKEWKERKNG
nr:hypothetical protein 1 [Dehalococcoidia bacterium]